jgi:hypothetical protein
MVLRVEMTFQYWFCVTVTIVSALTSTGFSFAALYGSAGSNRTNAMYVTSRSVALVVISAVPIFHSSPTWAEAAALAMVIVQAGDAAIGALQRDFMKTTGPAVLAGINLVALILLVPG